jgi:hypothetical protein
VLNSLSFYEKFRNLMEKHEQVSLYPDRDKAGMNCVQQALSGTSVCTKIKVIYTVNIVNARICILAGA